MPGQNAMEMYLAKRKDGRDIKLAWYAADDKTIKDWRQTQLDSKYSKEDEKAKVKANDVAVFATVIRGASWNAVTTIDDDWPRLALLLNSRSSGLTGTKLVWRDGFSDRLQKELDDANKDFKKDEDKKKLAQVLRKEKVTTREENLSKALEVEPADYNELYGQVCGALFEGNIKDDGWTVMLGLLDATPAISGVIALLKLCKITVQLIHTAWDQFQRSRLRASSVSVIEVEALSGAFSLGARTAKKLLAEFGAELATVIATLAGVESAVGLIRKAGEALAKAYLAIKREAERCKLNEWLANADWTDPKARDVLRENPVLALYLPFLKCNPAACTLGFVDPGLFGVEALTARQVDTLMDENNTTGLTTDTILATVGNANASHDRQREQLRQIVGLARATSELGKKDEVVIPSQRWLFFTWGSLALSYADGRYKTTVFKDIYERFGRFVAQVEKPMYDHEFVLERGDKLVHDVQKISVKAYAWEKILRFGAAETPQPEQTPVEPMTPAPRSK